MPQLLNRRTRPVLDIEVLCRALQARSTLLRSDSAIQSKVNAWGQAMGWPHLLWSARCRLDRAGRAAHTLPSPMQPTGPDGGRSG